MKIKLSVFAGLLWNRNTDVAGIFYDSGHRTCKEKKNGERKGEIQLVAVVNPWHTMLQAQSHRFFTRLKLQRIKRYDAGCVPKCGTTPTRLYVSLRGHLIFSTRQDVIYSHTDRYETSTPCTCTWVDETFHFIYFYYSRIFHFILIMMKK